jgi:hypothetical protein
MTSVILIFNNHILVRIQDVPDEEADPARILERAERSGFLSQLEEEAGASREDLLRGLAVVREDGTTRTVHWEEVSGERLDPRDLAGVVRIRVWIGPDLLLDEDEWEEEVPASQGFEAILSLIGRHLLAHKDELSEEEKEEIRRSLVYDGEGEWECSYCPFRVGWEHDPDADPEDEGGGEEEGEEEEEA